MLTKLYDKRDDFSFRTVNFPFICTQHNNISSALAYGVSISQLIRYARVGSVCKFLNQTACRNYADFLYRKTPYN